MKKLLILILCLAGTGTLRGAAVPRVVLVFPFENRSGRPDLDWLSEGMAELLASRLATDDWYVLSRSERNRAYQHLDLPAEEPLTLASEFQVAQTLGAQDAVIGNFHVVGNQLSLSAQFLDVGRLTLSKPFVASGALDDLVSLETGLAWRIRAFYDPDFTVSAEKDFVSRFPPIRLDAFENYIRGIEAPEGSARVHFLEQANTLDPSVHAAAFALGRDYFKQKNYQASAEWLGKMAPGEAGFHASQFYLGVDQYFMGNYAAAASTFSSLAQRIPLGAVSNNEGVALASEGKYRQALTNFEHAIQGEPTDADFEYNAAACAWYLQNYAEAKRDLELALKNAPNDAEIHTMLASLLAKVGDTAGQQSELAWLAQHEGPSGVQLAQGYMPQTRIKKQYNGRAFRLLALSIRQALARRLERQPPAVQGATQLKMGEADLAARRLKDATDSLNAAVALIPQNSDVHLALGELYADEKQFKKAAGELETSLNLKESVKAHLDLGRVYFVLHLPKAALAQEEAALRLDPSNAEAKNMLQRIASDGGEATP